MSKYDEVLRPFVAMMEKELHANAGKGDRPGWLAMSADTCLLEIFYHLGKLQKAVKKSEGDGIGEYAADVANMCMMLADICGVLALADPVPPACCKCGKPTACGKMICEECCYEPLPVPPAGGDVEVIAWLYDDGEGTRGVTDRWDVAKHTPSVVAQLVDRANVTRLQAEVEDLRRRCTHVNSQLVATKFELEETRDAYLNQSSRLVGSESELTKARGEAEKWEGVAREFAARRDELKQELDACNGQRPLPSLSKADLVVLNGLAAKNYQNARRLCQRASTPVKNAEAQAKLKLAENLMHALSNQSAPADKGRGEPECATCQDTGVVDDGEITGFGGVDFESGPVKCVKDCPACSEQPSPVAVMPEKYDDVLLPFLSLMRAELHANAHKGDRPGWLQMDRKTAVLEVFYHVGKLHQAVHRDEAEAIKEYAADVANMCMMLTDVCGYLNSEQNP